MRRNNHSPGIQGVIIRPETREDAARTAAVHLASWRAGHAGLLPAEVLAGLDLQEWTRRRVEAIDLDDGAITLVAVKDTQLLGHVTVRPYPEEPSAGQVWACYVHPEAFGTGIADELIHHGLQQLEQDVVRLWVARDNGRAVAFYQRHGFQADGAESRYDFRPPITKAVLPLIRMTLTRATRS